MKRLCSAVLTLLLAAGIFAPTNLAAGEITVTVDGEAVSFPNQQPAIIDGRTLVPVRGVFEHLGFEVDWDQPTLTATLTGADHTVLITANAAAFTTNGQAFALDVPAQVIHGSTMLPIRAVMESVGYYVDWDDATSTVIISSTRPIGAFNRDGIFVYGGSGWSGFFNPIMSSNIYDSYVNTLVFEGLVTNNGLGEVIPLVATHWEYENDYHTIVFHINPLAAFSDGRPLTAYDVEFTFTTMSHPEYDGPRLWNVSDLVGFDEFNFGVADSVAGIRVIDDLTIAFDYTFASPTHIRNHTFGILCREYYAFDTWDDFWALIDQPFGSGQFVFVDYVFQQWIEFERNENHWNPDVDINLAGIIMLHVPPESIIPAVIAGEIHMGQLAPHASDIVELNAAPDAGYILHAANTLRHVTFNTTRPHLSDHRVRQALAYAFDTETYIQIDTGNPNFRTVGLSPFPSVSWAAPDPATLNAYEFNMERAAELMDEAGWLMGDSGFRYNDNGERFSLHWLIYHEAGWPGVITGMASHTWGELGVELDIHMMDFSTVLALTSEMPPGEKDFDVFQMGWSMVAEPDLTGGLWDFDAHIAGGFNNSGWYNTRFQELIHLGRTTFDQNERIAIYHELAQMANYYLPVWVLSNGSNFFPLSLNIQNLENSAFINPFMAITQQGTWIAE